MIVGERKTKAGSLKYQETQKNVEELLNIKLLE
jgi:hypothetical protein